MKKMIAIIGILVVLVILIAVLGRKAGKWLVKSDEPRHADAIIMLVGSNSDRVPQVIDLYKGNLAEEVWIIEGHNFCKDSVNEKGNPIMGNTEMACNTLVSQGIPRENIKIIPGAANSTQMEALLIRDYKITQPGKDTFLLVSSATHTRRAFQIYCAAFKSMEEPVMFYCSPSAYTKFNAEKWWRNKNDIRNVGLEYLKMVNFVLFKKRELK